MRPDMYFMYVDESGDPGKFRGADDGNSQHYILTGIIVNARDWSATLDRLVRFRRHISEKYGLSTREEIHAAELIRVGKTRSYRAIRKSSRIAILRDFTQFMPQILAGSHVVNICLHKAEFTHVKNFQTHAWNRLANRYDQTLKRSLGNAPGIIISDEINDPAVRNLLRGMRTFNPTATRYGHKKNGKSYYNAATDNIVEDLFTRASDHSYFIQAADCIAHCLYRKEFPKGSLKKYGVDLFFDQLKPILFKQASYADPLGIVRK